MAMYSLTDSHWKLIHTSLRLMPCRFCGFGAISSLDLRFRRGRLIWYGVGHGHP